MRAFLLDDEPLAVKRLARLVEETGRVRIAGTATDPEDALARLPGAAPDVLFLDIEMPGMNGFEFLRRLGEPQPLVVFTTAYNAYALEAFSVNSIDYLLKPVERDRLEHALDKIDRIRGGFESRPEWTRLVRELVSTFDPRRPLYADRIASHIGDRIEFVETARVTHFYAKDKLTFAATAGKDYAIDQTIAELELKLDPRRFLRIHRSTIVNLEYVHELHNWFAGRMLLRLKDPRHSELPVARDRVRVVKERLGV